jgi:hypothetical protein
VTSPFTDPLPAMIPSKATAVLFAFAAANAGAQTPPPVRTLGPVLSTSSMTFGTVAQLVALPNGSIYVNDGATSPNNLRDPHRLVLLDSALRTVAVVLDSIAGKPNSYQGTFGQLMPFRGDSVLWYDMRAQSLIVIQPGGALGRVMAAPTGALFTIPTGNGIRPFASPAHGMLYGVASRAAPPTIAAGDPRVDLRPDSQAIVRVRHDSRVVDTVARVAAGRLLETASIARGGRAASSVTTPVAPLFPLADDATVTTDGSVVIYHASDHRLEWIRPNDTRSSVKLAYAWRRIPDDVRDRIIDSVTKAQRHVYDSSMAQRRVDSANGTLRLLPLARGSDPTRGSAANAPPRTVAAPTPPRTMTAAEFPDFYPAMTRGGLLADGDNNVWIRPVMATPDPRGAVWEVIDPAGKLIDRVVVPIEATIAGFAKNGIVFLVRRDGGRAVLQRLRWR